MFPYINQGRITPQKPAPLRPYNPNAYPSGSNPAVSAAVQNAGFLSPGQTPIWVANSANPGNQAGGGNPAGSGQAGGNTGLNTGGNQKAPAPDLTKLNYSFDPMLQDTNKWGDTQLATARARQLEQQKQLLLRFGSREMAASLLGSDPFVNTVSDDPYTGTSDLSQSRYTEIAARNQADINSAKSNLFFSSSHAGDVASVARERMLRDYALKQQLQSDLGGLGDQYSTVEDRVRAQKLAAEKDAYDRAVQAAILNWQAGSGTGGPPPNTVTGGMGPADAPYTNNVGDPFVPQPIQVGGMMDPTAALNAARLRRLQEMNA